MYITDIYSCHLNSYYKSMPHSVCFCLELPGNKMGQQMSNMIKYGHQLRYWVLTPFKYILNFVRQKYFRGECLTFMKIEAQRSDVKVWLNQISVKIHFLSYNSIQVFTSINFYHSERPAKGSVKYCQNLRPKGQRSICNFLVCQIMDVSDV